MAKISGSIVGIIAVGLIIGGVLGAGGMVAYNQLHHDPALSRQVATQAFLRGVCGGNLNSCEGVVRQLAGSEGHREFRVVVGRVFSLNGPPNTRPEETILGLPCTGISAGRYDRDGTCEFVRTTAPPAEAPSPPSPPARPARR